MDEKIKESVGLRRMIDRDEYLDQRKTAEEMEIEQKYKEKYEKAVRLFKTVVAGCVVMVLGMIIVVFRRLLKRKGDGIKLYDMPLADTKNREIDELMRFKIYLEQIYYSEKAGPDETVIEASKEQDKTFRQIRLKLVKYSELVEHGQDIFEHFFTNSNEACCVIDKPVEIKVSDVKLLIKIIEEVLETIKRKRSAGDTDISSSPIEPRKFDRAGFAGNGQEKRRIEDNGWGENSVSSPVTTFMGEWWRMTKIAHCFLPYKDFIRIIKEIVPVVELSVKVVKVFLHFVGSTANKLMKCLSELWEMFNRWLKGLKVKSIQIEVFGSVVGGQVPYETAGIADCPGRSVGATVFSSSSPVNLRDFNDPEVLEYLAGKTNKQSYVMDILSSKAPDDALIKEIRGNIDRFKRLNAMLNGDGTKEKVVILSPNGVYFSSIFNLDENITYSFPQNNSKENEYEESQEEILRSAQDDGSKEVKAPTVIPLSRHQPSVTVPAVPRVKEISQNRLEAIEDTEHMARKLEGLTADPNKAPPGEVISISAASKKPTVDPVNA
ncbi:MAG: hypothetical protein KAS66_04835, partial [Candidatus Omnitrophica bacterium]|nr:hypothetical protein [Candidatus Omnitrophota bacterium]